MHAYSILYALLYTNLLCFDHELVLVNMSAYLKIFVLFRYVIGINLCAELEVNDFVCSS